MAGEAGASSKEYCNCQVEPAARRGLENLVKDTHNEPMRTNATEGVDGTETPTQSASPAHAAFTPAPSLNHAACNADASAPAAASTTPGASPERTPVAKRLVPAITDSAASKRGHPIQSNGAQGSLAVPGMCLPTSPATAEVVAQATP